MSLETEIVRLILELVRNRGRGIWLILFLGLVLRDLLSRRHVGVIVSRAAKRNVVRVATAHVDEWSRG